MLTNIITATWSWWLFGVLVIVVGLACAAVIIAEARPQPGSARGHQSEPSPPSIWFDVPPRSAHFTGREDTLERMAVELRAGRQVTALVSSALYGLGGVGKTHLAIEYAARYASEYDLVAWLPAEQKELLRAALLRLADRLGVHRSDNAARTIDAVRDALRRGEPYKRWLLVFDNAEAPATIRDYLPPAVASGVYGHVLVTSRDRAWDRVADAIEVDVLHRQESVMLIRRRLPNADVAQAEELAQRLGDLPLAIEQATAWISDGSTSVPQYLQLLDHRMQELLSANHPADYPLSISAAWGLALDSLALADNAAVRLLQLCAFFGPEPISHSLLRQIPVTDEISGVISRLLSDPLLLADAWAAIGRLSLAKLDRERGSVQLHRLMRAYLRDRLTSPEATALQTIAQQMLVVALADIDAMDSPEQRHELEAVAAHFVAADCASSDDRRVRQIVLKVARYQFLRGDFLSCAQLCQEAAELWKHRLPEGDEQVIEVNHRLSDALFWSGEAVAAYQLSESSLETARRILGDTHPLTLALAGSFARDLRFAGNYGDAHALDAATLVAQEATVSGSHVRAGVARNNLAVDLRLLGRFVEALEVDEENLRIRTTVLGLDNWHSHFSRAAVALDHYYLGNYALALEIIERPLSHAREQLGETYAFVAIWKRVHALILRGVGQTANAVEAAYDALQSYIVGIGDNALETAKMRLSLANIQRERDPRGSIDLATMSLAQHRNMLGADHPATAAAMASLGLAYRHDGDKAAAASHNSRSLEVLTAQLGDRHWMTLNALANRATDLSYAAETKAARAASQVAYELSGEARGGDHPDTLAIGHNLALDLTALGDVRAPAMREEMLVGLVRRLGPRHPVVIAAKRRRRLDCDLELPNI